MKLNPLFSDHAVLQRGMFVPVWGTTKPGLRIRANIAGVTASTISNSSGYFILRLPPMPAGGPHTLKVTAGGKGESVTVKDVMIGEVWVCSGQSNMEMRVKSTYPDPDPIDCNGIRMLTVKPTAEMGRATTFTGEWKHAVSKNTPDFSAAGYYFARRLHSELGVPVGMISTSWGGTRIESWISRESLMRMPVTKQLVRDYEASLTNEATWRGHLMTIPLPRDPGNDGAKKKWQSPIFDDSDWATAELPGNFERCCGRKTNGAFWFRKSVTIPKSWVGRALSLHLGGADKHDVTYCNGFKVGAMGTGVETACWDTRREYKVPASRVKGTELLVAVRVWSFLYDGGLIGPANDMYVTLEGGEGEERIPLTGEWRWKIERDIGLTQRPPEMSFLPGNPNCPYTLHESMIAPLVPYGIRGAIWYQGESNADNGQDYLSLQNAMVADWRHIWGQGDFPFICVQLANFQQPREYDASATWPRVREAQLLSTRTCPNTGMASAIDIGDDLDIHPRNKREVGFRLAQWALARTYGHDLVANGPHYAGYEIEANAIRVRFTETGGGLVIRGGAIKTCVIAQIDRKFVPAQAVVEGDTLLVSAPGVKNPRAIRYAWANNPEGCNLYNADGLPASPFRTDNWN